MKCMKTKPKCPREAIDNTPYCEIHQFKTSTISQVAASTQAPIIISGGSVSISFPNTFKEAQFGNEKTFKLDSKKLFSLQIDDETPISLRPDSIIKIYYGES